MNDYHVKQVEAFFKAIEVNMPAYQKHSFFSYLALRREGDFQLAQGRLHLQAVPEQTPSGSFVSENMRAGLFRLAEIKVDPRAFVDKMLGGNVETPNGDLHFPPQQGQSHSTHFSPHHSEGLATQRRLVSLNIVGDRRQHTASADLDWELKASSTPFFNVEELTAAFGVGATQGEYSSVDVIAHPVAAISSQSMIDETTAKLGIELGATLDTGKAAIGYRVFDRNRAIRRDLISGANLSWEKAGEVQNGWGVIEVPKGAVIDCIASYAGTAQSYFWVADSKTVQNPYRSIHFAFDNNMEVLLELIERAQRKSGDARDLEMAVSWLLWLLGFSTSRIGGTGKTSDAPDIIASTPAGHFIVVECTTGILKENSKLAHLYQRTEKVRQSLVASGNLHMRVLPIIVTTKSRDEVRPELEQAYKLGALVITRDEFKELIDRTVFFPDPNRLYNDGEEAVRRHHAAIKMESFGGFGG